MEGSGGKEEFVFCGACGTRLDAGVRFCTSCGASQAEFDARFGEGDEGEAAGIAGSTTPAAAQEQAGGQPSAGAFSDWFFGRSSGRGGGETSADAPTEAMPAQGAGDRRPPTPPTTGSTPGPQPGGQRSLIESLFDVKFEHLITPKLVQFFYVLSIIVLTVGVIAMIAAAFAVDETTGAVVLFLAPLSALLYLIMIRLWLELIVVAFKIRDGVERVAENTKRST